ncbi:MAG: caspase family protein, partial [Hyphomicrobiales bacterium]|nr:caspase family protein [Hyphomicrobiales bacterium]
MLLRALILTGLLVLGGAATPVEARRVALVIGQNAYSGLKPLDNPRRDARQVAALLARHGFEVLSCKDNEPGCYDLDRTALLGALRRLEAAAKGAETALVYFAGHGLASEEGNILTPTNAAVNCRTGAVTHGVTVERFMEATNGARHKLLVLDSCRDNPIGDICPGLAGKKLSFTRIEAGAMQGLLLVTSTQFGQQALDGAKGANSPFATAFLTALDANPTIYFEQVMNEVARATFDRAQKDHGFQQIPGKVVGGAAPADCLAGTGCVGDARMAALSSENEKLSADASAVRNIIADEERQRGRPYTPQERAAAVERIGRSLTSLAGSAEPKVQEATRLFRDGKVAEGRAKLDEALDDDEKAAAEIERLAKERRRALARNARDAAALARGSDIAKALTYYERATRNEPEHAQTWQDFGYAAVDAGRLDVAKIALEQAALKARDANEPPVRYWATLGLGDVALAQGSLPSARRLYETALAIVQPLAAADPGNAGWQRDLSVSHNKIGDVLVAQGSLPAALASYRASHAIAERLAAADPGNAGWQFDLGISNERLGDVLASQGNLAEALKLYEAKRTIISRLAKADPGNAGWQRDLSVSHNNIGDVLVAQGSLPDALASYRASLAIAERLAAADPGNAGWQRDLSVSHNKIGDVLVAQGSLPAALDSYSASLAIAERLAAADPGNAGWQRDLSV